MGIEKNPVLLGLGSNLGDRKSLIQNAWRSLEISDSLRPLILSRIVVTKPVGGPPNQPDFLNAVGLLETSLNPFELLEIFQRIEKESGRVRHQFWGTRTLDLDILLYGDLVLHTEILKIPHPRMVWRPFVLEPAREITPKMHHPVWNCTLSEIADLAAMNFRLASFLPFLTRKYSN